MRRVNPDIRHVLIGKAYAAELLRTAYRHPFDDGPFPFPGSTQDT